MNSRELRNHQIAPTTMQTELKEKPLFLSRAQRFTSHPQDTPGPGAYEALLKEKHTMDYRVARKTEEEVATQHQWILGKGRFSLPSSTSKFVGPGLYNPEQAPNEPSHSNWAKKERFGEGNRMSNPLGPGQYGKAEDTVKKEKPSQLSVFKSRSPRTFFEQIIMKEQKSRQNSSPEDEEGMVSEEIVKFDETTYPIRKKVDKLSPVFLSKCVRPQLINDHSPQGVGPGSYSVSLQHAANLKNSGVISAIHYNVTAIHDKKPDVLTSKITPPGPGAYQEASTEILKKKPLGIIAREERFKANSTHEKVFVLTMKTKIPGPGEYMKKRYTMINEEDFLLKSKISPVRKQSEQEHNFGRVARATLRNHSEAPFGQYNVQLFDMNYKLKKQKEHYDKLKLMEVTLPAFNSKPHH